MPVFTITEDEVTRLALPDYDNGLNEIQNGTFNGWVFNKSGYNSEISKLIGGNAGTELLFNGIDSGSALSSIKAIENNLIFEPSIEIVEELAEEIIDDFDLELLYDFEESDIIDVERFMELLRNSGIILEEIKVKRIFDGLDKNNTGTLEYNEINEFVNYLRDKRTKLQRKKMLEKTTSEKNVVNIDTRYRSKYYNTSSTDFNYEIPAVQKNVINMRIGSIELPTTNYTVSSKLGNNTMLIISDATSKTIEYDVSGSWRFKTQIGDISAEYNYGTIIENTSINVVDVSSAGAPLKVTPHNNNWKIEYYDFSYVLTQQQLTEDSYTDISYYAHFHGKGSGGPGDTYSQFRHGNGGPSYSSHLSYTPTITPITNVIFTTNEQPNEITSSTSTKTYEQQLALDNLSDVQTKNDLLARTRNDIGQYRKISTNIKLPHPETNELMDYSLNHVPGSKQIDVEITTINNIQTTTTKTIINRYYNFIRLRRMNWRELASKKPFVWNGLDGNHNDNINKRRVLYSEQSNDIHSVFKFLNVYSPRGNPRRTDISFNNLKYLDEYNDQSYNEFDTTIKYPFDCSMMYETTTDSNVKKEVHLNALQYINAKDGSTLNGFNPVKCAWLVRIPDGNYDEAWNGKLSRLEKIVNDSINVATPGAIDVNGNFAAFKNPKHYDFINDNTFKKNILFKDNENNYLKLNNFNSFQFQIDRISKRSTFATSNIMNINNKNQHVITTKITKVNKFTLREGQSGLRTLFGGAGDWGAGHPRYGEPYPEMLALLSNSREPKFVHRSFQRNPELIKMIRFNVKDDGSVDNETNIQHKLGWVLGFRSAEYLVQ